MPATAMTPPTLKRGRKGKQLDKETLDGLVKLLDKGEWASDGETFKASGEDDTDARDLANRHVALIKRELVRIGARATTSDIRGRAWYDADTPTDGGNKGAYVCAVQYKD